MAVARLIQVLPPFRLRLPGACRRMVAMLRLSARCERCQWRQRAAAKPDAFLSRLWRWHTRWCPMWKRYQRELATAAPVAPDPSPPAASKPPRG